MNKYKLYMILGIILLVLSITDENTIEVPAKKSKTIYYKTTNTNK